MLSEIRLSMYLRLRKINMKMKIIVTYPKDLTFLHIFHIANINWIDINWRNKLLLNFKIQLPKIFQKRSNHFFTVVKMTSLVTPRLHT